MEKIIKLLDDYNNDLQSRQHGGPTNPFSKQKDTAERYPNLTVMHPEDFYTSVDYYPEETRAGLDVENIEPLIEVKKNVSFTADPSVKETAGVKKAA